MIIAAIVISILFLLQMLELLVRHLRRDGIYNQNIWIHGGYPVEGGGKYHHLLETVSDRDSTVLKGIGMERVTSSFAGCYIRLYQLDNSACYDAYLEKSVKIGRKTCGDPVCEMQLEDTMVSKQHCMIYRRGEQIFIQDLGSTNHTYVNGCLVEGSMPISHGDQLNLGSFSYQFQCFSLG